MCRYVRKVLQILRGAAGLPKTELDDFKKQATSGDYNNLLSTCLEWFYVE